ncbi:hypothetical protein J6590_023562 [Homalodisca vitripennis]|nr:hypothetical protein J6590_023562 [Homalodisca vitripennis]
MSLINAKSYTETPDDWRNVIKYSRIKPSPFTVIDCAKEVKFETWTEFLSGIYVKKCPITTRPIRVFKINQKEPSFVLHKANYFGSYLKAVFVGNLGTNKNNSRRIMNQNDVKEFYNGKLPIKPPKLKDLLHLKHIYDSLAPALEVDEGGEDAVEYADDPPIDEAQKDKALGKSDLRKAKKFTSKLFRTTFEDELGTRQESMLSSVLNAKFAREACSL